MALTFADPFDALFRFQRALEQRLDSGWLEDTMTGTGAFPPINAFQQGNDFVAIIEMPGISKDDLGLEVRGNTIRISGKKTVEYGGSQHASPRARRWQLRSNDQFARAMDPDRVVAEYRDGILALSLPRAESDKPKAIKVN
jgi:HSP20 family protein